MEQNPSNLSKLLRQAITDAPSLRLVERETGVPRPSLRAFLRGKSLRLDKAELLMAYFGIESRKTKKE
jgi:hypothetical protein